MASEPVEGEIFQYGGLVRNENVPEIAYSTASDPITTLEQIKRTVKDLLRKADRAVSAAEPTFESREVDQAVQEQISQAIGITDHHYRNRDAAVYAVAILHMVLQGFAVQHSAAHPAFLAHRETIDVALQELGKYPEDVLAEYIDQMKDTILALVNPQCSPTPFHHKIADRIGKLVSLAQDRKYQS